MSPPLASPAATLDSPIAGGQELAKSLDPVIERLTACQRPDGGWPYQPAQDHSFTEPTCWSLLALLTAGALTDSAAQAGAAFLESVCTPKGGFHAGTLNAEANWSTALAVLTLRALRLSDSAVRAGVEWLLGFEGQHFPQGKEHYFGHDTTIRGWPWVAGCHSWIEPTCYAVIALKAVGLGQHERTREAVRMILDRALPDGGWNYGNTLVLGQQLRGFPSTTGMALVALAGAKRGSEIENGLGFLARALPQLRSPWALGWTGLAGRYHGFEAFGENGEVRVVNQVNECLRRQLLRSPDTRLHELAVLALSALPRERLPFADSFGIEEAEERGGT